MNKENKVTSLKLSKKNHDKAKEKGFELPESEWYWAENSYLTEYYKIEGKKKVLKDGEIFPLEVYPAYDITELSEMLPPKVESNYIETTRCSDKSGFNCLVGYLSSVDKAISFNEKTMAEAMGKMYFYLLENDLL